MARQKRTKSGSNAFNSARKASSMFASNSSKAGPFAGKGRGSRRQQKTVIPKSPTSFAFVGDRNPSGKRRSTILIVVGIVLAIALAVGVGVLVYQQTVKSSFRPSLNEDVLESTLASVPSEGATWTLFVQTDSDSAASGRGEVVNTALIATDSDASKVSVIWIPADTEIYVAGYGYHTIAESLSISSKADLKEEGTVISSISSLTDQDISHYVEVNSKGLDAYVEDAKIDGGTSVLANRDEAADAIIRKILGTSSENVSSQANLISTYMACDMSSSELADLIDSVRGVALDTDFQIVDIPTTTDADGNTVIDSELWASMSARVREGKSPTATANEENENEILRSTHTVSIWNGVGVNGIANDCAEHLENAGWEMKSIGNAAAFVYTETLVVYKYDDDEEAANLIVSDLGQGRAVRSAARYSYDGDLLVVVGQDYQPY